DGPGAAARSKAGTQARNQARAPERTAVARSAFTAGACPNDRSADVRGHPAETRTDGRAGRAEADAGTAGRARLVWLRSLGGPHGRRGTSVVLVRGCTRPAGRAEEARDRCGGGSGAARWRLLGLLQ